MNYYINIIDTENSDFNTVLEMAQKSSIVLSYKGSDAKDDLQIVGSTLKFTILVASINNVDGVFEHMFTGDEQRYKIELRKEISNTLIWQGFILPDDYSEPYKAGVLNINFTSTDGLGRLKGKFLEDSFYTDEKTVTEIIAACLKLTGLSMPFYFCPSIENYHQTNYHSIYIPGTDFIKNNKKDDAYKILNYFANDLLFCVFQSMGYWHLEGLNKRNLLTYNVNAYNADGVFVENIDLTRNIKVIDNNTLVTPNISTVVPYGTVTVDHKRVPVNFKPEQTKEINDGWAVTTGVNPEIYSTEWYGTFFAKAIAEDYNIIFYNNETNVFDITDYVGLRSKLYLQTSEIYKLQFEIQINDTEYNQEFSVQTDWYDPINYKVTFNDERLFSNFEGTVTTNERLKLIDSKTIKVSFEFVVPENGLLDFIFYEPFKDNQQIVSIQVNTLSLERIGFEDLESFTDEVSENYTRTKEKSLTFSDDASGYSKAFRLEKLSGNTLNFNSVSIPILYSFSQNGRHYSAVQLDGANIIAENLEDIYHVQSGSTEIFGVIYNYQGNEPMLVETGTPNLTGTFAGNIFYRNQGPAERQTWLEWTDSIYQVEKLRFADVHAKIYRRLFKVPHIKVDLTINYPVLFNDMIQWHYKSPGNYFINNLRSWNLDTGKATLTINKAVYQNDESNNEGENLPPFVDAGTTIYITDTATSVDLVSVANDPDGFIVSYQWQQITTIPGVLFIAPNNANCQVTNLTENFYTFQITVTDNDGAIATDTVNVVRLNDYLIAFEEILNTTNTSIADRGAITTKHFQLTCTPPLPDNFNLTIGASYEIDLDVDAQTASDNVALGQVILDKNGAEIVNDTFDLLPLELDSFEVINPIPFNYNNTDTIVIKLIARASFDQPEGVSARSEVDFDVSAITFASGEGNVTTVLPLNKEALVVAEI